MYCNCHRRNPDLPPKEAAERIVSYLKKRGFAGLEVFFQDQILDQNREHCTYAPFSIVSDYGGMVNVSLDGKFNNFTTKLGYWSEPYDDAELCFMPTDPAQEKMYRDRGQAERAKKVANAACQADLEKAKEIMAAVPVVGFPEGMHQFTWIRMRDFVSHHGKVTRECIIDSEPHRLADIEMAFEEIRRLRCVANIYYNLD